MIDTSRFDAAWWGGFIGDALAMPVHWYYTRNRIAEDYGDITTYLPPHNPHPDSFLWRSEYTCTGSTDVHPARAGTLVERPARHPLPPVPARRRELR